jgi:putative FmdB family regulatory protein
MPIYAYRCESCDHELEALQKLSDPPLTDCPACGASALKKQITAAAFRLKGGGWYETDFKQNGKKNIHEAGDKSAGASGETADKPAKSDSTGDQPKPDTAKAPAAKPAATSGGKPEAA